MSVQNEHDQHESYLDAVFGRIDRIRQIDASVLTERYGIDPAALSPAESAAKSSWIVGKFLVDADAQREELHEHLDALTREFIADGLTFKVAALKAQSVLGNPETLAMQITKSTARNALAMDRRWFPWLRSIASSQFLLPFVLLNIDLYLHLTLPEALAGAGLITTLIGFIQGYSVGVTVTPDLWRLFNEIRIDLKELLKLPVASMSLRQRANRLSLSYAAKTFGPLVNMTNSTFTGRFSWGGAGFQLALMFFMMHLKSTATIRTYLFSLTISSIAREWGCCVGTRHRLAQSMRRAS